MSFDLIIVLAFVGILSALLCVGYGLVTLWEFARWRHRKTARRDGHPGERQRNKHYIHFSPSGAECQGDKKWK